MNTSDFDPAPLIAAARNASPGPWEIIRDDTGGEFSGWPSVLARPEDDKTVVHRAGFHQEYWGDWSQRDACRNAEHIATSHPSAILAWGEREAVREGKLKALTLILDEVSGTGGEEVQQLVARLRAYV